MKTMTTILAGILLVTSVASAELATETLEGWTRYVSATERRIEAELASDEGFLVQDFLKADGRKEASRLLRKGQLFTKKLETLDGSGESIAVPKGLVHHWMGSIFIPGARLEELVTWLQDYDEHDRYFQEVEDSRLLSRDGEEFEIFLRLRRKKVVTVHYNTKHRVRYERFGEGRVASVSYSTRIAEIDNAGTPAEVEKAVGDDRGFLWRLNSYWRFEEAWDGVIVELESISLSRGIPFAVRWLVGRYLDSVPRESLEATLLPIRRQAPRAPVVTSSP